MIDLDEQEAAVLKAARKGYAPGQGSMARVRSATFSAVAAGVSIPNDPGSVIERCSNAAQDGIDVLRDAVTSSRAVVTLLVLSGVGGAGYALGLSAGRAQLPVPAVSEPSSTRPESPTRTAPEVLDEITAPAPESSAAPRAPLHERKEQVVAPPKAEPAAVAPSDALQHELRTLRRVERAQREQNPRFALALLDELERSVPGGKLLEERSAARAVAACGLESAASVAGARAAEFSARYPRSVYLPRVREACAVDAAEQIAAPPETDSGKGRHTP
jgi:hypothetical protein